MELKRFVITKIELFGGEIFQEKCPVEMHSNSCSSDRSTWGNEEKEDFSHIIKYLLKMTFLFKFRRLNQWQIWNSYWFTVKTMDEIEYMKNLNGIFLSKNKSKGHQHAFESLKNISVNFSFNDILSSTMPISMTSSTNESDENWIATKDVKYDQWE